jgi:hypothetical protein
VAGHAAATSGRPTGLEGGGCGSNAASAYECICLRFEALCVERPSGPITDYALAALLEACGKGLLLTQQPLLAGSDLAAQPHARHTTPTSNSLSLAATTQTLATGTWILQRVKCRGLSPTILVRSVKVSAYVQAH